MASAALVGGVVGFVAGRSTGGAKPPVQQMTFDRSAKTVSLAQKADFSDAETFTYGTEEEARAAAELAAGGLDWTRGTGSGNDTLSTATVPLSTTAGLPWSQVRLEQIERKSSSLYVLHLSYLDASSNPGTAQVTMGLTGAWAVARHLHWASMAPSRSKMVAAAGGGQLHVTLD